MIEDKSYEIKDKMKSIIISDSSSLIDFCNITNGLELLKKCFNPVFVPQGVYDEIIYKEQKEKIDKNNDFVKVLKDYNDIEKNAIKELIDNGLHKGESEAIAQPLLKTGSKLNRLKSFYKIQMQGMCAT